MNPKRFLVITGTAQIIIGLLGVLGLLEKISSAAFFHPPYWINWFHIFFGPLLLSVSKWDSSKVQTFFTAAGMITGLSLGLVGLLLGPYLVIRFNIPELSDPSDHLAHLSVGLLALWGWLNRKNRA